MKTMKQILNRIKDSYWSILGWRIRYFFMSMKNLIRWTPIIWHDRDWDHRYIYDILQFKLENQAKYIGDRDFHTGAKRDAERMITCARLIDRVKTEFYSMEYMDYHKTDFEFIPCADNLQYSRLEIHERSNTFPAYFSKYPRQYKRALAEENWPYTEKSDRTIALWMSEENEKRAQKILFKMLDSHIRGWWD